MPSDEKKIDLIALRLPAGQCEELRAEAASSRVPVSAIVREGIDLALEKRRKKHPRGER